VARSKSKSRPKPRSKRSPSKQSDEPLELVDLSSLTRDEFLMGDAVVVACRATNTAFSANNDEVEFTKEKLERLADYIRHAVSPSQIVSLISVLKLVTERNLAGEAAAEPVEEEDSPPARNVKGTC
jgi:hypothetical protein